MSVRCVFARGDTQLQIAIRKLDQPIAEGFGDRFGFRMDL